MLVVPFTSDYAQRFITQLGDEKFRFDSYWNERGQTRVFDLVRDSDGETLLAGAPMQIGQDLLAPYALGIGGLLMTDLGRKDTDAGPEDLGTRVIVTHLSPDELAAIKAILGPQGASIVVSGVSPPIPRPIRSAGSPGAVTPVGTTINNVTINNIANATTITGGGLAFSDSFQGPNGITTSSGDEVLIGSYLQMPNLNPNPTVALEVAIYANGAGSLRCYIGGTFEEIGTVGTPSGSLAATAVAVSGPDIYPISATPANPAAPVLVKITMESDAPATEVGVNIINGFLG